MNNGHSRETGNMGYTRLINVREYLMGNKQWTFQKNWQHGVHKINKRERIPNGQYTMDIPEKLATWGTQDI